MVLVKGPGTSIYSHIHTYTYSHIHQHLTSHEAVWRQYRVLDPNSPNNSNNLITLTTLITAYSIPKRKNQGVTTLQNTGVCVCVCVCVCTTLNRHLDDTDRRARTTPYRSCLHSCCCVLCVCVCVCRTLQLLSGCEIPGYQCI